MHIDIVVGLLGLLHLGSGRLGLVADGIHMATDVTDDAATGPIDSLDSGTNTLIDLLVAPLIEAGPNECNKEDHIQHSWEGEALSKDGGNDQSTKDLRAETRILPVIYPDDEAVKRVDRPRNNVSNMSSSVIVQEWASPCLCVWVLR